MFRVMAPQILLALVIATVAFDVVLMAKLVRSECPPGQKLIDSACDACPYGSYKSTGSDVCVLCDAGSYCSEQGLSAPIGACPELHYCPQGTIKPYPCPANTTSPAGSTNRDQCVERGDAKCPPGSYTNGSECELCPAGTVQPEWVQGGGRAVCVPCPSGFFCSKKGLSAPEGACTAGFYCPHGSTRSASIICPEGYACPAGSTSPSKCSNSQIGATQCESTSGCKSGQYEQYSRCYSCTSGTFQPTRPDGRNNQICQPCPAGHYCSGYGLSRPTGRCNTPGYYCPIFSTSQTRNYCPRNHYCPATVEQSRPVPCPPGTSSGIRAKSSADCKPVPKCPTGMYQDGSGCIDCPKGTYLPTSFINSETCLPCDAGKYCQTTRLTAPTGSCSARYYCPAGSTRPDSKLCPKNHYCAIGTATPSKCPKRSTSNIGSYRLEDCRGLNCGPGNYTYGHTCRPCGEGTYQPSWTKGKGIEACRPCDEGKYCSGTGLIAPTAVCAVGYVCLSGSTSPTQQLCPKNHYCPPNGDSIQTCPPRTTSKEGATSVRDCITTAVICPPGSHSHQQVCRQCPSGTYAPSSGSEQCTICPAGKYCNGQGLIAISGTCTERYYCPAGSKNATTVLCPEDHYCRSGQGMPVRCSTRYTSYPGSTSCFSSSYPVPLLCPAGHFLLGGVANTCEKCPPGTSNAVESRNLKEVCKPCPAGFYCEAGSTMYTGECSAGYFCPVGSSHPESIICPVDHFCPAASARPVPCPDGEHSPPGASSC